MGFRQKTKGQDSSLSSVVFKPAGFIVFCTVTDSWISATRISPEDL